MKKIQINKSKLQLSKEKVATLTTRELMAVRGGSSPMLCFPGPNTYDVTVCCTGNTCTSPSTDSCPAQTDFVSCLACSETGCV